VITFGEGATASMFMSIRKKIMRQSSYLTQCLDMSSWINHGMARREVVMRRWVHRSRIRAQKWNPFQSSLTLLLLNSAKENMAIMVESGTEILHFIWSHAGQVALIKVIKKLHDVFGIGLVNDPPSLRQLGSLSLRTLRTVE
jgi:hypothetical protein